MQFKVDVQVTLKRTVNDPQGLTIKGALQQLGFEDVAAVRAGQYIEVWLEAPDRETAEQRVAAMCDKLLANPVIRRTTARWTAGRWTAGSRYPGARASGSRLVTQGRARR